MNDIAPEILERIQNKWDWLLDHDETVQRLLTKIESSTTSYSDAHHYAILLGEHLAEAVGYHVTPEAMPDQTMYFNIAQKILTPLLTTTHKRVSAVCATIQKRINERSGYGIKAIAPKLNTDKIRNLCGKVSSKPLEETLWTLQEPLVNFSQSVVDDAVKANSDFQYNAGMRPKIVRTVTSGCCNWCEDRAGTYDYSPSMDKRVFQRHEYCRCLVEYEPGNGGLQQDVWSKKWQTSEQVMNRRKEKEQEAEDARRQKELKRRAKMKKK